MLVISAGMQKSGSGYLYNLLNALLYETYLTDARSLKEQYQLHDLMQWHNNNIGRPTFHKLFKLWIISRKESPYTVKTHEAPGLGLRILHFLTALKVIYIFRDPRDVILSAIDHGIRSLRENEHSHFAELIEFDDALRQVTVWVEIWRKYNAMRNVLMIKYEDLHCDALKTMKRIEDFLEISVSPATKENILWQYSRNNPSREGLGLHFNKATAFRYETEMNFDEKRKCRQALGKHLEMMGYSLE
jgi:hypothetical protein